MPTSNKGFFIGLFVFALVLLIGLFGLIPQSLEALDGKEFFIKDKSFFLKKITATAISSELYRKYKILTAINDSSFSNHLCVSPSLIIKEEDVNYFFDSLSKTLDENLNIKSIELNLNFIKSKL